MKEIKRSIGKLVDKLKNEIKKGSSCSNRKTPRIVNNPLGELTMVELYIPLRFFCQKFKGKRRKGPIYAPLSADVGPFSFAIYRVTPGS